MPDLRKAIEKFMSSSIFKTYMGYTSYTKQTVSNLLKTLIENYSAVRSDAIIEESVLQYAMEKTVQSYTSSKRSAIRIFGIFMGFLKKEYGFEGKVTFPEIDISSSFERQMYLAKMIQSEEYNVDSLAGKLWVSKRTLEEDLKRIRGRGDDLIQICGKPFVVKEVERKNGKVSFASTVHPFFLTFNLTQVIATLKGLKGMSLEPAMKHYAIGSAAAIWQQLSDYAKERILYVMTEIMPEEISWYRELDDVAAEMFQTEYQYRSTEGPGVLMDCIKNEKTCFVEYRNEDGNTLFLSNCRYVPRSYKGDRIEVTSDQGNYLLSFSDILRSAYTKEGLI